MKHFLVINPHSFKTQESLDRIIKKINNSFMGLSYEIYISRYSRDAIPAVHRYVSSCPMDEIVRIYAVGGDGILFDCLNGMVDLPNAELTSVPYGTNNAFIHAFGKKTDLGNKENIIELFRDFKALAASPSRRVDIINCGSNYAMLEVNIGLIGQMLINKEKIFSKIPERLLRNNVGLTYTLCATVALFNTANLNQHYSVFLDGENISGNYYHIKAANLACNAGSFVPNPCARPDSGSFELVLGRTVSRAKIIGSMGDYNKGRSDKHDFFVLKRGQLLEVKSDRIMSVMIDDEAFYTDQIKLELIPGGIKFFAPEDLDFVDYSYKVRR